MPEAAVLDATETKTADAIVNASAVVAAIEPNEPTMYEKAGEIIAKHEPAPEPQTKVIPQVTTDDANSVSASMLERAALFDISKEDAEELGPKALNILLDKHIAKLAQSGQEKVETKVETPEPKVPKLDAATIEDDLKDLEADGYTPALIKRFKGLAEIAKRVEALEKIAPAITDVQQRVHGYEIQSRVERLDKAIKALPDYEVTYGKGPIWRQKPDSEAFKNAQKLMVTLDTMAGNFAKQNKNFDDYISELAPMADSVVRPDRAKAAAKAELEAKTAQEKKRLDGMTGNRPASAPRTSNAPLSMAQMYAAAGDIISKRAV